MPAARIRICSGHAGRGLIAPKQYLHKHTQTPCVCVRTFGPSRDDDIGGFELHHAAPVGAWVRVGPDDLAGLGALPVVVSRGAIKRLLHCDASAGPVVVTGLQALLVAVKLVCAWCRGLYPNKQCIGRPPPAIVAGITFVSGLGADGVVACPCCRRLVSLFDGAGARRAGCEVFEGDEGISAAGSWQCMQFLSAPTHTLAMCVDWHVCTYLYAGTESRMPVPVNKGGAGEAAVQLLA